VDLDPAPTQGQLAPLLAVPISLPLGAVLAPRAHQLSQLLLEDLADRRQPEPDRECQQPAGNSPGAARLLKALTQPSSRQPRPPLAPGRAGTGCRSAAA